MKNLVQIQKSYVSRSAILEHFTCPYKHYLTYWAQGTGVHPGKASLDLLIGSTVHRGLQHLFEHCRVEHPNGDFEESCIDKAVEVARELWEKELSRKPLALKSSAEYDRLDWIIAEQECLWEGLIRAFAIHRLPLILEEYDILEVEFEEVFENFSPLVTFLGKADGLFMRKKDKALVILSIKTSSEYAEVTTRNIKRDMQGVSETYLAQERFSRAWKELRKIIDTKHPTNISVDEQLHLEKYNWMSHFQHEPRIFAVQYEYLIKGQRRKNSYNENDEEYYQQSFLCHPMKLDAINKIFLGAGGSFVDPAKYKWKWKSGKQPKGWQKIDIWNDIGIKNWITLLATGEIQPELGHPFDHILHTPDLITRSDSELQEWLISTRFLAERIRNYINNINEKASKCNENNNYKNFGETVIDLQEMIWQYFPKNTQSCHNYYGSDCHFVQHCHELESIPDMVEAESLTIRQPHHELERQDFIEKGYIEDE